MRCSRAWIAVLATALALLVTGCPKRCETSDRAPVPADVTPRFAVLAYDETRTQISLLDQTGALVTFPTASPDDAPERTTDVWLDETYTWDDMLATRGMEPAARLTWTSLPSSGVTVATTLGGREIVRFPFDTSAPEEIRTAPALVGMTDTTGAVPRDLAVAPGASPGGMDELYVLRDEEIAVIELDPRLDEGGALVDTLSLEGTSVPDVPAAPGRMVLAFDRLFVGLDRYAAGSTEQAEQVGPGALAIVDPAGRRVVGTFEHDADASELRRCSEVAPGIDPTEDPERVLRLVVACRGVGEDLETQARSAGVIELRVERDPGEPARDPVITIENVWRSSTLSETVPTRGLVPLPGRAVAFVSAGDAEAGREDVLYVVDLDADPATSVRVTSEPLLPGEPSGLGTGAFLPDPESPGTGLLVWPVGRNGVLRRRIRTAPGDDGSGLDVAVCPDADEPACLPEDAALEEPIALCNGLFVEQVRLVTP